MRGVMSAIGCLMSLGLASGCESKPQEGTSVLKEANAQASAEAQGSAAKPFSKPSTLSLALEGGDLAAPIRFEAKGKMVGTQSNDILAFSNSTSLDIASEDGAHVLKSYHCSGIEPKLGVSEPSSRLTCVFRFESKSPVFEGADTNWEATLVNDGARPEVLATGTSGTWFKVGPKGATTVKGQPKTFGLQAELHYRK